MTERKPHYLGFVSKDPSTGEIGGEWREVVTGWPTQLRLVPQEQDGKKGYRVEGYLGPPPGHMHIDFIDNPENNE